MRHQLHLLSSTRSCKRTKDLRPPMAMTTGHDPLSIASRSFSSAKWRYFCYRQERQRTLWRLPTLRRPGAPCCVTLDSHVATDECGAPEFFGGGLKLVELPGGDGKITTETLKRSLADQFGHSPHQMIASALSITQATEVGTVYRQAEIAALCKIAHQRSLAVHMDGARFANALVRLNATRRRKSRGSPVSTYCRSA